MKKLQIFAIAFILTGTSITAANAQLLKASLPAEAAVTANIASVPGAASFSKASIMDTKAGLKAVKKFTSRHTDGDDVKWVNEKNQVISASYNRNNEKTCVVFDKHGHWIRDMKIYGEDKMPNDVRRLIRNSAYAAYKINQVQEIQEHAMLFYVVHLEDATTIKQIVICDGEMGLFKELTKQQ